MDIEFLKALRNVLEDMTKKGKVYSKEQIAAIAPHYTPAICSILDDQKVVTFTSMGIVIKANGNLERLLEETKADLTAMEQAAKDHRFNRFKDYIAISISVLALLISIISLYLSSYKN